MYDVGLTHVALPVTDLNASVAFYKRYANMKVVHRRQDEATVWEVAWITDGTRPFVVVLLQGPNRVSPLLPDAHLGVACTSRQEVDLLCRKARAEECLIRGPEDAGPPVGYWALLKDPDGHTLELSFGQQVGVTVGKASRNR